MSTYIKDLLAAHPGKNFELHDAHLNTQMVRVPKTSGPYLYDNQGQEYLDLLSGFGVFALGRNHPVVVQALKDVLEAELPDMVQMDVSLLSGLLAEAILKTCPPNLTKMIFCNSGA